MMQSYTCATHSNTLLPFQFYYSVKPGVVGVIADLTKTVTPSGATSIAAVEVRSFASASPPYPSSVSLAGSKTSILANPSSTHLSVAHARTTEIVTISLSVLVAILALGFGLWRFLRRRGPSRDGCCSRHFQNWTPSSAPEESVSRVRLLDPANEGHCRPLACREAALPTLKGHSASIPRGLKGGASPIPSLWSDFSQPTQPYFR